MKTKADESALTGGLFPLQYRESTALAKDAGDGSVVLALDWEGPAPNQGAPQHHH